MRWQDINKHLLAILIGGGVITLTILFAGLDELAGVTVTYHSPDQVCDFCTSEIHVNTTYWEICFEHSNRPDVIFKKSSRGRRLWVNLNRIVLTDPLIHTAIFVPTYGNKLRLMKDGDCLKRYNKNHRNVNKIHIYGEPDGEIIKWGVPFLDVDPIWVGYKVLYENVSRQVPVMKEVEKCFMNKTCHNFTELDYYETEYYNGERKGIKVAGKEYPNDFNVEGNNLVEWNVPIGDRNFEEYGGCREYEKAKGVCKETPLI